MKGQGVHALIPAAGHSVRFGGTTLKQYAHLLGMPVMAHSIEAVSGHPSIDSLTVALTADDGIFNELIRPAYPDVHTVIGGDSRARTVMNGVDSILDRYPDAQWVLVHDAARPCLSRDDLDRLLQAGLEHATGAILAIPINDTLKLADPSGNIEKTIDRSLVWAAQTPQLFRIKSLASNLCASLSAGEQPTDEAMVMERAGLHPGLVAGSSSNIKITGAADLELAEFILQRQSIGKS